MDRLICTVYAVVALFRVYAFSFSGCQPVLLFLLILGVFLLGALHELSDDITKRVKHYDTSIVTNRNNSSLSMGNKNSKHIRILCLILTTASAKDKMVAVNNTWAKRCDKHLFIYGDSDGVFATGTVLKVPVHEHRTHLTGKVRHALQYAYQTYNESFDWIMKCDDDTYVIMENLRYLLSHADPNQPGYLGFHMKTQKTTRTGYMSGGGGYVISSRALHHVIRRGFQHGVCRHDGGDEDVEIGLCLAKSGVRILNSLDVDDRETFHPESLERHLYPPHPHWLNRYAWNQVPTFGVRCCSRYSISFHRVSPAHQFMFEHLLYNTVVHMPREGKKDAPPMFDPHVVTPAP